MLGLGLLLLLGLGLVLGLWFMGFMGFMGHAFQGVYGGPFLNVRDGVPVRCTH